GVGAEEAAADLPATVGQARAHLALGQRVAGVADPGARTSHAAVARTGRAPGPVGAAGPAGRRLGARGGRAHPAPRGAIGVVVVERAADDSRRAAARTAPVAQCPPRHPARVALAAVAGVALA